MAETHLDVHYTANHTMGIKFSVQHVTKNEKAEGIVRLLIPDLFPDYLTLTSVFISIMFCVLLQTQEN